MSEHTKPKDNPVNYPNDRKLIIGLKPNILLTIGVLFVAMISAAWIQYLVFGLPVDPSSTLPPITEDTVKGFPLWVALCHWVNFFFLVILIRSGLSILMDHPRLYWNNGCTPGSEWLKFTPLKIPEHKIWTAKVEARYISPIISLPGYRHTVGIARGWHFIHVPFFLLNGVVFVILLFLGDHWQRIIPSSLQIIPDAWSLIVHYATLNIPEEPNGFYHYNALQQLSYFVVIFIFAPVSMLSGMCMSPAIENRFHWLPKLFGNRQGARSVHFLVMLGYAAFLVVHVSMVIATGLIRNLNHITIGTDNANDYTGLYIVSAIVLFTVAFSFYANWVSWNKPRWVQRNQAKLNGNLWRSTINKLKPRAHFKKEDISPYFWANGKLPTTEKWLTLAKNNFKDYKLEVDGLVENPLKISLEDLMKLGKEQNVTMHHCIQGWSGIAEWGGIPIKTIVEMVKPHSSVTTVVFHSFGEGLYGGTYYDTHTLDNCLKPESILAWEMNYEMLPELYGAPLRLRVENQLGYKMVKWIERIEFVETHKTVGKGYGGTNEDAEFFDLSANT